MFFNSKQLKIFKGVKERVWHQQNNLRKPFEKQWRNALKNWFNQLASGVKEAYRMRSQIMLDFEMRKQAETLKLIFRVQYTMIGNAFKDYALGRLFLSKAFDQDFDKALAEFIDENTAVWVTEIDETTRKRMAKVISNSYNDGLSTEETGTALRNMILGMGAYRANLISRTESHRIASFASEQVAENMNISGTQKEWVAIQDARTRLTHSIASGQTVPLETNFVVGGDRLKYPGDPRGTPAETINCRCAVIYRTPDFQ